MNKPSKAILLLFVASLVLAACGKSTDSAAKPAELVDPSTLALNDSGLDVIKEGETTFIKSGEDIYAIFFEIARPGLSPEYTDYTVGWSKYDPTNEFWSVWETAELSGIDESLILPQATVVDSKYEAQPGEVVISGSYRGEGGCVFDACFFNYYEIWLKFSSGKGG